MNTTSKESKFMSNAYQAYRHFIEQFSDSQQSALHKLVDRFANGLERGSDELYDKFASSIGEGIEGRSVVWINLGDLLDAEESVIQRDIQVNKVYSVLADSQYGILLGNPIINPLIIGESLDENGDVDYIVVESGRHRISGTVTMAHLLGFDEEEILEVQLPCFVMNANNKRIIAANKGRGCTKYEEIGIMLSEHGINVNDAANVWTAFVEGRIPGTPTSQRSAAMRLIYILSTSDEKLSGGLTEETRGSVAVALIKALKEQFPKDYKLIMDDNQFIVKVLNFAKSNLVEAVRVAKETMGVTNMARAHTTLAAIIAKNLKNQVAAGTIQLPKPVVKEVPAVKEPKQKTSATRTTKKSSVPQAEGDAPVNTEVATEGVKVARKKTNKVDKPVATEV